MSSAASSSAPVLSGSMNWEPVRKRLLGADLKDALKAATELRENIEIVHTTEFPLMLSALLPAFSSVLAHRTRPSPDSTSIEHKFRNLILDIISKFPNNEVLRPHAPHLVALAIDILNRDYEDNALLASRIIFDLYKVYRSLPQDYVQPYLDFVISAYRSLPSAVQMNFTFPSLSASSTQTSTKTDAVPPEPSSAAKEAETKEETTAADKTAKTPTAEPTTTPVEEKEKITSATTTTATATTAAAAMPAGPSGTASVDSSGTSPSNQGLTPTPTPTSPPRLALKSNLSFRVLTECPLIVMLMFQLYPKFLKINIPVLINVMMEALSLRAPSIQTISPPDQQQKLDSNLKRLYFSRTRELVAAQAKTLSFVTYLLRSFSNELKPYEDRLATNVVALMTTCPRESISTRKEMLVATRHLLNCDFRKGFFRHVDALLDERVLLGTHHRFFDQTLLRPLGYTTLSDLVQHVRAMLTMSQMSRVVVMFSRVLHDSSMTLPMSTQYTAVRTLLSVVDIIYHNKDPDPQIGRDMLVQILNTLVEKLASLNNYFPTVVREEKERATRESKGAGADSVPTLLSVSSAPPDSVRDLQIMIRAIIVGHKTVIYYLNNYRNQRDKEKPRDQKTQIPPGSNEEVSSAQLKLTHTEVAIIDKYILTAFSAAKLLKEKSPSSGHLAGGRPTNEKPLIEQQRDSLTYFAAAFTTLDGYNLSRTIGKHLDLLVDAIVDDPMVMVVPRHLLGANPTTSYEFCSLLLDHLIERMDELALPRKNDFVFFDPLSDPDSSKTVAVREKLQKVSQLPAESEERQTLRSTSLLQLFERVLKSLSTYPENESIVRRQLRKIVVTCLRSSMEETDSWPDNYCMLLRYVFRSISAGKFEESYKELLPLIPTVLNGLYRVICASRDAMVRHAAVELCLTIPARLSSLLPHMNLLLRVIIPALDSDSGDLVNLGLRTLEFWVDNLNPLFLYPEMSKQIDLFTSLMQALSRHLRPAPYPYGLLTLRLLGKLGGKNRQFLREPLLLCDGTDSVDDVSVSIDASWTVAGEDNASGTRAGTDFALPLPLDRCVEVLKSISSVGLIDADQSDSRSPDDGSEKKIVIPWSDNSRLWTENIENFDTQAYGKDVTRLVKQGQAESCMTILRSTVRIVLGGEKSDSTVKSSTQKDGSGPPQNQSLLLEKVYSALLYASMIDSVKEEANGLMRDLVSCLDSTAMRKSLVAFLSETCSRATRVGLDLLRSLAESQGELSAESDLLLEEILDDLCRAVASNKWADRVGLQEAICVLLERMGSEWSRKHELELVNAAMVSVKSVPSEMSSSSMKSLQFFIRVCAGLYGTPWEHDDTSERCFLWDTLAVDGEKTGPTNSSASNESTGSQSKENPVVRLSDEVFRLVVVELASPQQLARFAARFLLSHYTIAPSSQEDARSFVSEHISLIRRVLFSRSLRLLPLSQQVGVVEGLAALVTVLPGVLPLSDQHLLAFLSELLKMSSVADGEMSDDTLKNFVMDRNGYNASLALEYNSTSYPTHASALFHRRECVIEEKGAFIVVPEDLPVGVQLRVSAITLLYSVIRGHVDPFFDAEASTPIGNIRPHVVSLLFRSLISKPLKAVVAAHDALRYVLKVSMVTKRNDNAEGGTKSQSRLPKELLQTCIRPVLLNLRDYTRLSVPLLRGLSRLLSLLSSWFNKTLGEKLLEHLQKWSDPARIISHKVWNEGEEPLVAAAIVDIFSLLPHASHFVDPLVKTCIKLEATLPAYKVRRAQSPYRRPLARFLNRHAQHAVAFFFQRLKTPMYSELFQSLICLEESAALRSYLSDKQCSVMILNYCFERPLAIIRSEKSSTSGGSSKSSLLIHGIGNKPSLVVTDSGGDASKPRPMNVESLELQLQGFRLVQTLLANDASYLEDHNDIVRAFRWLWRSKGRFLRPQHEDAVSPRFHSESTMLASFLMAYGKSFPSEGLDILFELIRVFLQPSTRDFTFVSRFLSDMVSHVLSVKQKQQVMQRFFALLGGESSEETKVLSIQFLIFPMLSAYFSRVANETKTRTANVKEQPEEASPNMDIGDDVVFVDRSVIGKFVKEVLFQQGSPITCGDRMKVELLKLSNLFVQHAPDHVEPYRKEMVRFCWGLLKSEDTSCKGWAYIVVCRFIHAFDTPVKIVLQVYAALLRSHQQEGRELVRGALDVLVPSLPRRLPDEEFQRVVEQASKMMLEDGNSTPQLAHISQMIVRNPGVFYPNYSRFVGYMVNSLNRLGLPPSCPPENRVLAVDIVDLLLDWEGNKTSIEPKLFSVEQVDTLTNFLIRLKILMSEPTDARAPRIDIGAAFLEDRVKILLGRIVSRWNCTVRSQPFEKVLSKDPKTPGLLLSCLEIFSVLAKAKSKDFFRENSSLLSHLLTTCFDHAKDYPPLRKELRLFVSETTTLPFLTRSMMISLEKVVLQATLQNKKNPSGRGGDSSSRAGSSRNKEKQSSSEADVALMNFTLFAVELISETCQQNKDNLKLVANSLLALASTLTKSHLLDSAAKQRHGPSNIPRITSSGVMHHTPTVGILETACTRDPIEFSKPAQLRSRAPRDDLELGPSLQSLLIILRIFEDASEVPYHFTQNRKILFQILGSILETSDCVQLLVVAARTVGKWLLASDPGAPTTAKERNSFLWKLASFDFGGLYDDVVAQPFADLIALFVQQLSRQKLRDGDDIVLSKSVVACLLNPSEATRATLYDHFLRSGDNMLSDGIDEISKPSTLQILWRLLHGDYEGLGGRSWITVFVDSLLQTVTCDDPKCIDAIRVLAHGDVGTCQRLFDLLLPSAWTVVPDDGTRVRLVGAIESLLSRPFHAQFLRDGTMTPRARQATNMIRTFLSAISLLKPIPVLDSHLLAYLAENYNCWYEVLQLLERQFPALASESHGQTTLSAMRHCYRLLGEDDLWLSLARESCRLPLSRRAISFDAYSMVNEAAEAYAELVALTEASTSPAIEPSEFEMDMWEERWIEQQKELCQREVVSDFASSTANPYLELECAWKSQDWSRVRTLCSSTSLLAAMEKGDPSVKICETLLAVADGKLNDVENLHAQTAQLCLYRWQLLPQLSSGSPPHASLLHFFHRLVEIRESGQIMVETSSHANARTLPDLKNLLNAWRHRLPNDCESMMTWDDIFAWRANMFSSIISNFQTRCEPNRLATLHDRPWTIIRMAKTARKQCMRDVSLLLLNKTVDERAMSVSDAFLKLREQILAYYNPDSDLERHGGLNLINTTNLSFFDEPQKSELFRLKGMFLASLGGRSKANQAYCHSVQICPTHARAWESWGDLCSSLGAVAEKQLEQPTVSKSSSTDSSKDPKAISKKVAQYLAQAMGCYMEAIQIDANDWARIHLPKCLWMLTKDGSSPGVLCQTFESRGVQLPPWVWLTWLPQLLSSFYRPEGRAVKSIFARLAKSYPQAVYYSLRAFYLERRDVERAKGSSPPPGQHMSSVVYAEEIMSLLRRSHASLWSSLESILEELIVKFRPLPEEELLSPINALLERAEAHLGTNAKNEDEDSVSASIWKTIWRIANKFFRPSEPNSSRRDERAKKTAEFKEMYRESFEADFQVSSADPQPSGEDKNSPLTLEEFVERLRNWKLKLEKQISSNPVSLSLIKCSQTLAMYAIGDAPDLWPGSCDPRHSNSPTNDREESFDKDTGTTQSSTSSSAAAAKKAATTAAAAAAKAATREGVGGDFGASSCIEIPGQYMPNTSAWADMRPNPELHAKLMRFDHDVQVLRRGDQLVRRIGMIGSDGKTYYFLVQAAVPYWTRTDERTAQTYCVLDKALRKCIRSSRSYLSVQPHSVIPMAQRLRLVSEPHSRISLEDIYKQKCYHEGRDPSQLVTRFNEEIKKATDEVISEDIDKEEQSKREREARLEVFNRISESSSTDSCVLLNHLRNVMGGPETLYQFRRMFAQQWAANCLLQHGFCVAERTPGRVVLVESSGRVLSPEFRVAYNSQGFIEGQPLPFRLTPNLEGLMGFPLMDGRFVTSMATIAGAVREFKQDLEPVLRLLMRDDLMAFYTRSMPKSDSKSQDMEKQLAERILKNVAMILGRIGECAPNKNKKENEEEKDPIDIRVRDLIDVARSPEKLCMMHSIYQGWL